LFFIVDLTDRLRCLSRQESILAGEFLDQRLVISIGRRPRARPGQACHHTPRLRGRAATVTYQVSRMRQRRAVMPGHAMEKDRLPARIGQQVGGLGHLLESRP
jgi:hypothetical protein